MIGKYKNLKIKIIFFIFIFCLSNYGYGYEKSIEKNEINSAPPAIYIDQNNSDLGKKIINGEGLSANELVVAVLADGLNGRHPDLNDIYIDGYDAVNNSTYKPSKVREYNEAPNGSSIASIIAANSNEKGLTGVAYGVKILPIVVDKNKTSDKKVSDGIRYAIKNKAKVINLSMGIYGFQIEESEDETCKAIEYAKSLGIIVVTPSYNDEAYGKTINFEPARCKNSLAVLSIKNNLQPLEIGQSEKKPFISALGEGIVTSMYGEDWFPFHLSSRNNFGAAYVTAAIALIISKYPNITYNEILKKLEEGATDIGEIGNDVKYGSGLLDIRASLGESKRSLSDLKEMISKNTIPIIQSYQRDDNKVYISWQPPIDLYVEKYIITGYSWVNGGWREYREIYSGNEVRGILDMNGSGYNYIKVSAYIKDEIRESAIISNPEYIPFINVIPNDATITQSDVKWTNEGISVIVKRNYNISWDLLLIDIENNNIIRKYKIPSSKDSFVIKFDKNDLIRGKEIIVATGIGRNGIDNILKPQHKLSFKIYSAGKKNAGIIGDANNACREDIKIACEGDEITIINSKNGEVLSKTIIREDLSFATTFLFKEKDISLIIKSKKGAISQIVSRTLWYR